MEKFPKNFFWGAATSAYQVEGGNKQADWWHWEKVAGKETSGQACRHYELFEKDFDLAKELHHNAHRFSIEWSRIEPKENQFSEEALQHYKDVLLALKKRGIEPIVTLHHFTNPEWFSQKGGWEHKKTTDYFLRYCDFVVSRLAGLVRYWMTINEPTIYVSHAYLFGAWPPQFKSFSRLRRVESQMIRSHVEAYRFIHGIYKKQSLPPPSVGIAQHVMAFAVCKNDLKNRLAAFLRYKFFNESYLDQIKRRKAMDFIGVNYYSRQLVHLKRWGMRNLLADVCDQSHDPLSKNFLGWDIYPQGLLKVLMRLKKYRMPVMITENGICTSDDNQRWEFIRDHLESVRQAIKNGVDVIGYLYWSLLDNFEWDKGFAPRFGLIDVDYQTFQRTVRPSALKFADVCRSGDLGS